jgi:hypothetical protein
MITSGPGVRLHDGIMGQRASQDHVFFLIAFQQ